MRRKKDGGKNENMSSGWHKYKCHALVDWLIQSLKICGWETFLYSCFAARLWNSSMPRLQETIQAEVCFEIVKIKASRQPALVLLSHKDSQVTVLLSLNHIIWDFRCVERCVAYSPARNIFQVPARLAGFNSLQTVNWQIEGCHCWNGNVSILHEL